jgi:hypothetical protein
MIGLRNRMAWRTLTVVEFQGRKRERERQTETLFFRVNIYLEPGSVHLKTAITHCAIELDILGNLKAFQ